LEKFGKIDAYIVDVLFNMNNNNWHK
jgi:hypothetical protein